MKTIQTQVAGIQFKIQEHPFLKELKPEIGSKVHLLKEEYNEYDKLAVKVIADLVHVGYLPKDSEAQKAFHEGKIKKAFIHSYTYATYKDVIKDGKKERKAEFNTNDEGVMGSITLQLCLEDDNYELPCSEDKQNCKRVTRTYERDGRVYESITSFLSRTKELYEDKESIKRLKDWQDCNKDGLKLSARLGSLVHRLIEEQAKENIGTAKVILDKLGLNVHSTEQTVYNKELGLAGTYDLLCTNKDGGYVLIDWKSSKNAQKSHHLQTAFYSHCVGAVEAYVVCLGAENNQGFTISKVDIEKNFKKLQEIKSLTN